MKAAFDLIAQERELTPKQQLAFCESEIKRMEGLLYDPTRARNPHREGSYEYALFESQRSVECGRTWPRGWKGCARRYLRDLRKMRKEWKIVVRDASDGEDEGEK